MGGLRKYMPITYWTVLDRRARQRGHPAVRGLLLQGLDRRGAAPVDDARRARSRTWLAMAGVFVSGVVFVPARVLRLPRQGALRRRHHDATERTTVKSQATRTMHGPPHESPWVVTVPLILLAIPSVVHRLAHDRPDALRRLVRRRRSRRPRRWRRWRSEFHGWLGDGRCTRFTTLPLWLALARRRAPRGSSIIQRPDLPAVVRKQARHRSSTILERKYGFDDFNDWFFAGGARRLGNGPLDVGRPARSSTASW